jgi:hypothetical protein
VTVVVVVERLSLCSLFKSKPKWYISVTHCFIGDKPAKIGLLSMSLDEKPDELALAERFELFSSVLHINMMLICYDNSSTIKA